MKKTGVYANGNEIACKASSGKSIAQFPDVCMTPPTAPPTPNGVPVPYPNTAMAKDCKKGSKRVKIGGQEVFLAGQSYISRSTGDEAGSAPQKNIITGTTSGKAYFKGWSMNVRFEGKNVSRHLDPMTHNHASEPGDGVYCVYQSCRASPTKPNQAGCTLTTHDKGCEHLGSKPRTPHHCVPDHCFKTPGPHGTYFQGAVPFGKGLCICVEGSGKYNSRRDVSSKIRGDDYDTWQKHYSALAEHGRIHAKFDEREMLRGMYGTPQGTATLGEMETLAAEVIAEVTGCDEQYLREQIREHHDKRGLSEDYRVRCEPYPYYNAAPMNKMGAPHTRKQKRIK